MVDRMTALEGKTAHHSLILLSGKRGCREHGGEQDEDARLQMMMSGFSPVHSPNHTTTVKVFDTGAKEWRGLVLRLTEQRHVARVSRLDFGSRIDEVHGVIHRDAGFRDTGRDEFQFPGIR